MVGVIVIVETVAVVPREVGTVVTQWWCSDSGVKEVEVEVGGRVDTVVE